MKSLLEFIQESLRSHDTNILLNKIKDICLDDLYNSEIINSSAQKLKIIRLQFDKKLYWHRYKTKINKLLKFFNYFVTIERMYDNGYEIFIEPLYSDSISNKIYDKNFGYNGIVYHISERKYINNILNNGLIARECSPKSYRYYPERIFCFSGTSINEIKSNIEYMMVDMWERQKTDVIVYKIDLNNHNGIMFFTDPASGSDENLMLYFHTNIPENLISIDKKLTQFANDVIK